MKIRTLMLAASAALLLCDATSAQTYQLTREESVRLDNPRLQPRLDWMVDDPAPIDKQSFRVLAGDDYVPYHLFVRFLPGTGPEERAAAHAMAGMRHVVWQSQLVPDLYLVLVGDSDLEAAVNAYLDHPRTLYAEPNYRARLMTDPNDPYYSSGELWGMGTGNNGAVGGWGTYAQWAWDEWQGSQDFVIAIIDSGVQISHPDVSGNLWSNPGEIAGNGVDDDANGYIDDVVGWDFRGGDNDPTPSCSDHGTHVAGTVGGRGNNGLGVAGVNWHCSLMALRCESTNCSGLEDTVEALDYAVANGARVSNNSYGRSTYSQAEFEEIQAAQALGHIFVTSAGNDGVNTDVVPHYPSGYSLSNIISVAGVEPDGDLAYQDTVFEDSFDSSYGPTTIDLAAPGVEIVSLSTSSGYAQKNGTSMAAPHVAGVVALVWSKYPELTWTQVRDRVLTGTNAGPTLSGKCVTGGTVNAHRALGIWLSPGGGGSNLGTYLQPFSYSGVLNSLLVLPKSGTLNFQGGTLTAGQWGVAQVSWLVSSGKLLGAEPMILRSTGGAVRIGVQ